LDLGATHVGAVKKTGFEGTQTKTIRPYKTIYFAYGFMVLNGFIWFYMILYGFIWFMMVL
jgi:hypothetical protein